MILSKEEYFKKIKDRVGDSVEAEDISFIEDMTDTYTDLSSQIKDDYKGKYVYIDRKPVEECTAEICFMSPMTLAPYETALKMIGCTDEFTDEQKLEKIISMNTPKQSS